MSTSRSAPITVNGHAVGSVGFGMMGLTKPWSPVDYPIAVQVMKTALEQGANLWNGGIHYGTPQANSLHLLKHYFQKYPEDGSKVVLCIKGGFTGLPNGPSNTPEGIRASVEEAVKVLDGTKTIDIFECARVDPEVPVETTVNALAELVKEGKIGGIGLSEVNANTVRKVHAIHPVSSVEIELSLFTPEPLHNGIMDACHELDIPLVAYSPISRGWLTGDLRTNDDLAADDIRRTLPRFKAENFDQNFKLVEAVEKIAKRKGVTVAQVAIGWVCRVGGIPIPGSVRRERVIENSQPASLTEEDMAELQRILDTLPIAGERYSAPHARYLDA
ncbi:Aldo/keto reductase [Nemania sp. FL0916]|nr:Aldo/keto reductase [Nemania sp. FL0916]